MGFPAWLPGLDPDLWTRSLRRGHGGVKAALQEEVLRVAVTVRQRVEASAGGRSTRGECHSASLALCLLLAEAGIPSHLIRGLVSGQVHWWVEAMGLIADVTCDQFNGADVPGLFPRVLVCPAEEAASHTRLDRHSIDFETVLNYIGVEF